jgi:hypothetical protein
MFSTAVYVALDPPVVLGAASAGWRAAAAPTNEKTAMPQVSMDTASRSTTRIRVSLWSNPKRFGRALSERERLCMTTPLKISAGNWLDTPCGQANYGPQALQRCSTLARDEGRSSTGSDQPRCSREALRLALTSPQTV